MAVKEAVNQDVATRSRYGLLACCNWSSEAVPQTDASYRSIAATRDQPGVGARR